MGVTLILISGVNGDDKITKALKQQLQQQQCTIDAYKAMYDRVALNNLTLQGENADLKGQVQNQKDKIHVLTERIKVITKIDRENEKLYGGNELLKETTVVKGLDVERLKSALVRSERKRLRALKALRLLKAAEAKLRKQKTENEQKHEEMVSLHRNEVNRLTEEREALQIRNEKMKLDIDSIQLKTGAVAQVLKHEFITTLDETCLNEFPRILEKCLTGLRSKQKSGGWFCRPKKASINVNEAVGIITDAFGDTAGKVARVVEKIAQIRKEIPEICKLFEKFPAPDKERTNAVVAVPTDVAVEIPAACSQDAPLCSSMGIGEAPAHAGPSPTRTTQSRSKRRNSGSLTGPAPVSPDDSPQ